MKLSELPAVDDDEADFDPDEQDSELEEDLTEARDLIEAFLNLIEPLIRLPRGKKITYTQEKELVDACMEASAFIDQWEKE